MTRISSIFLLLLAAASALQPARADHAVVLVAAADSPIASVDSLDIRKVYLGFTVLLADGEQIRALYNASDPRLREIFLQDVMGMSARTYDRRLLSLALQSGRRRPESFDAVNDLLRRAATDKYAIAFMWEEDARERRDVKVLKYLWRH